MIFMKLADYCMRQTDLAYKTADRLSLSAQDNNNNVLVTKFKPQIHILNKKAKLNT